MQTSRVWIPPQSGHLREIAAGRLHSCRCENAILSPQSLAFSSGNSTSDNIKQFLKSGTLRKLLCRGTRLLICIQPLKIRLSSSLWSEEFTERASRSRTGSSESAECARYRELFISNPAFANSTCEPECSDVHSCLFCN